MKAQTKISQSKLTPKLARDILIEGNARFVHNLKLQRNLQEQVADTSTGQYPFAIILSCIDSRVSSALIFDQGIGALSSVRIAGNVVNQDILGSIEYACKVLGSKIVLIMGHTKCGAVTAACKNVQMGNITNLLNRIRPAVEAVKFAKEEPNEEEIEKVTTLNIHESIKRIREESSILKEMEEKKEIEIVGAIYNVASGKVDFM